MPLTHRISISVQALTPKLNLSPLLALASGLVTLTHATDANANAVVPRVTKVTLDPAQPFLTGKEFSGTLLQLFHHTGLINYHGD